MKIVFAALTLLLATSAQAQFFYQDIIAAGQSKGQFLLMKKLGIRRVEAKSLDPDGSPTPNFILFQKLDPYKNELATYSKSDYTGTSVLTTRFNPKGQVLQVVDSSSTIVNRSTYAYLPDGKLKEVEITAFDNNQNFTLRETHYFNYSDSGQLQSVLRVKNGTDTSKAVFIAAENGLPGEEQWWKGDRKVETWYYYYDEQNRLTDIVRYNARVKQMLPDYVFEYQQDGKISKQTTVHASTGLYRIWTYEYDTRGLKTKETVLNKYKQPEGSITYQYQ